MGAEVVGDDKYSLINFEETELRLGLPGGNNKNGSKDQEALKINNNGKRGFCETSTTGVVDLKLNLSSKDKDSAAASDIDHQLLRNPQTKQTSSPSTNDVHAVVKQPPAK